MSNERLEKALKHARTMERKAGTRCKRAATLLKKWQRKRQQIERRMAVDHVQRIVNKLALGVDDNEA